MSRPPQADRLLVLHSGALGDCVLALHFAAAVKAALGASRLTMAARSAIAHWAAKRELIDDAFFLDQLKAHRWYAATDHVEEPPLHRFDAIVSFLGGPNEPVTHRLAESCRCPVFTIDPRAAESGPSAKRHIVRQWAAQLDEAGIDVDIADAGAFHKTTAPTSGVGEGEGLTVVHVGSGGTSKCCPLEPLERIVVALRHSDRAAAWMIGPDEMERDGPALVERLRLSAPVIFRESVEEAADVVSSARAFIGNDAGMTHVAALCGVKTIALFGPTDPHLWRPLGPHCRTVPFAEAASIADDWPTFVGD